MQREVEVRTPHVRISFKNMPSNIALLLAAAVFILALGVAFSFIRGWSTINAKVEKKMNHMEELIKKEADR